MNLTFRLMMISETLATAQRYPHDCADEVDSARHEIEAILTEIEQKGGIESWASR